MNRLNKRGQSEMVGFAIIVIIVAILILIFISLTLNKSNDDGLTSSKTESFLQSLVQYTTDCEINSRYHLSFLDLVRSCSEEAVCDNGKNSCELLNETSKGIINKSWKVGENFPVKGYSFSLSYGEENFVRLEEGNKTSENRGSKQTFSGGLEITFTGYY